MGWNDAFAQETDWTALTFQQMFQDAVSERVRAGGGSNPYPTPVAAGFDCSSASYIASLQSNLFFPPGTWLNKSLRYEGTAQSYGITLTSTALATAAGLSPVSGFWRRKRPREVVATGSTSDTQGNAAVIGQKAVVIGSFLGQWDGSAWLEIDPTVNTADTLDTNLAAPNRVLTRSACQVGDYIGPWIWTEIRNVANQLVWLYADFDWQVWQRNGGRLAMLSPASASSEAQSLFANAPAPDDADPDTRSSLITSSGSGRSTTLYFSTSGNTQGAATDDIPENQHYYAEYQRSAVKITASAPAFGGKGRLFEYYVTRVSDDWVQWTGDGTVDFVTGDTQGDPVGASSEAGMVTKFLTTGPLAAASDSDRWFGTPNATAVPNLPPFHSGDSSVPDPRNATQGYAVGYAPSHPDTRIGAPVGSSQSFPLFVVVKWDVPGGFRYSSSGGFAPGVAGLAPMGLAAIRATP